MYSKHNMCPTFYNFQASPAVSSEWLGTSVINSSLREYNPTCELKKTIEYLTNAKKAFGLSSKFQMQEEKEKLKKQVKSIVASKNILPNQKITIKDISFKVNRGDGLDPSHLDKFIGKKIKKKLSKDDPLLITNLKI